MSPLERALSDLLDAVEGLPADDAAARIAALADAMDPEARWEMAFLHGVARAAADARRLAGGERIVSIRLAPDRSATFAVDPAQPATEALRAGLDRALRAALAPAPGAAR